MGEMRPEQHQAEAARQCFVIMAFGREDTERVWTEVYRPVCKQLNLEPIRVDQQDDGRLVPQQIIEGINGATMIIGDLTHERPNCYLEIGMAMGQSRYDTLILTCRGDHDLHRAPRRKRDPKVHFDLQSFGILWWEADSLASFRRALKKKMKDRLGKVPVEKIETPKPLIPPPKPQKVQRQQAQQSLVRALDALFGEHKV